MKQTFAANTFATKTFASSTWRGVSAPVTPPTPSLPLGLGSGGYDRFRKWTELEKKQPSKPVPTPLPKTIVLYADGGRFTLTGHLAVMRVIRRMEAQGGSFALSEQPATLRTGHIFEDHDLLAELTELLELDDGETAYCARVAQLLYPLE